MIMSSNSNNFISSHLICMAFLSSSHLLPLVRDLEPLNENKYQRNLAMVLLSHN